MKTKICSMTTRISPVSYAHLDVYKRQTLLLLFSCGKEETKKEEVEVVAAENQISVNDAQFKTAGIEIGTLGKEEISAKITLNGSIAVSYTHLDVYKRQLLSLVDCCLQRILPCIYCR